ncbi:hypothetical protein WUBG_11753 [Wuchereria bancrofti]|nr:hypothetical protein WUBG_11753 [Wuchereria bancrofti]
MNAEPRVLLPAHLDGTQIEFQLHTYSVGSSSLYNALPPPNSRLSTDTISYHHSLNGSPSEKSSMFAAISAAVAKANPRKFFAPPPSAASLSTYGVVKPAGMRVHLQHGGRGGIASTRNRRKQRYHSRTIGITRTHSPPPSYSKVKTTRPVHVDTEMGYSDEEPQQLQVPTSSRIIPCIDSSSMESTGHVLLPSSNFISSTKFTHQQHLLDYSSTSSDVSFG